MSNRNNIAEIIPPKKAFVGDLEAPLVLMEFGEYENESCAKANDVVKKLLKQFQGEIKFNFRHFPLIQFHQLSHKASEAAVAALQEGKFWEMHNVLFANRRNLGTTSLKLYSKEAGVHNKKFLDDLVNAIYGWQVQGDLKEGLDRGVKDVPAFFVNDELVEGRPTFDNLSKAIDAALKKAKRKPNVKQRA